LNNSYGPFAKVFVNKFLNLEYACDLTAYHPAQKNVGTHEFIISYDFPYKQKRFC